MEMKGKLNGYQEEGSELIQFNKELQWTLMAMKKDNDQLKDQVNFVIEGGDVKQMEKNLVDGMFSEASSPNKNFRTPHIDNVFDLDSEFHPTSAGIAPFNQDGDQDDNVQLRVSRVSRGPSQKSKKKKVSMDSSVSPIRDGKGKSISPIRLDDALSGSPPRNTSMINPQGSLEVSKNKSQTPERSRKSGNLK